MMIELTREQTETIRDASREHIQSIWRLDAIANLLEEKLMVAPKAAKPGVWLTVEEGADVLQLLSEYPSDIEIEIKSVGICAKIQKQLEANNDDARV
jgi:hypothetical protein